MAGDAIGLITRRVRDLGLTDAESVGRRSMSSSESHPDATELRAPSASTPDALYLELLKQVLTRYGLSDVINRPLIEDGRRPANRLLFRALRKLLSRRDIQLVRTVPFEAEKRENGLDWPLEAETMIGLKRLNNLQFCVEEVLRQNIPGDLIECGVWRGGSCIFMRGALKAHGCTDRAVWVADSFEGLPKPDPDRYPPDGGTFEGGEYAVSLDDVKRNFKRYGLLDEQVRFLRGYFADTLPSAPIHRLAVLRLDGDLYSSTIETLDYLYPKLSPGGYLIADDYQLPAVRQALHDYRTAHHISDEIIAIDSVGVYWQKTG